MSEMLALFLLLCLVDFTNNALWVYFLYQKDFKVSIGLFRFSTSSVNFSKL